MVGCGELYKSISKSRSSTLACLAINSWVVLVTRGRCSHCGGITCLWSSLWSFYCRSHPLLMPTAILCNLVQMLHEELDVNKTHRNRRAWPVNGIAFCFLNTSWECGVFQSWECYLQRVLWAMMFFDSFFDFLHGKEVPPSFPKSCLVLLEQTREPQSSDEDVDYEHRMNSWPSCNNVTGVHTVSGEDVSEMSRHVLFVTLW